MESYKAAAVCQPHYDAFGDFEVQETHASIGLLKLGAAVTSGTRICVDVTASRRAAGQHATGIIRVERELASRATAFLGERATYVAFDADRNDFFRVEGGADNFQTAELSREPVPFAVDTKLLSFGLECNTKNYRQMIIDARLGRYVLYSVLYDLTAPLNPQLSIDGYGEFLRGFFGDMVWGVSKFFAISEHSKRQLALFCEQDSLPLPPCDVFPLGADAMPAPSPASPEIADIERAIAGRTFPLCVSTIEARKNHYCLYRAWARAVRERRVNPEKHCLVLAGHTGWGVRDLMEQIATNPDTKDSIVFVSRASDEAIARLYQQCQFFVFPSFDEGYGLPVAEALSAGKFCLSSDRGALPEVGGDLVEYIDPLDVLRWSERIGQLLRNPSLVMLQERRIREKFNRRSWDESAAAFYRLVSEGV